MFPLGHVGIGLRLIPARLRSRMRWGWLALGCVLPDLIDKPLWLAARGIAGDPLQLGLASGTRLFGHTLLLVAALAIAGRSLRSVTLQALSLGALTHLLLDLAGDLVG